MPPSIYTRAELAKKSDDELDVIRDVLLKDRLEIQAGNAPRLQARLLAPTNHMLTALKAEYVTRHRQF
jgi:hypothetical protein